MSGKLIGFGNESYNINDILISAKIQPIVFFGAGYRFSTIESRLIERNIPFVVTDNDPRKQGNALANTTVISPQKMLEKYRNSWVCITATFELPYDEIYGQLIEMGFSPTKIVDFKGFVLNLEGITLAEINKVNEMLEDKESKDVFSALCYTNFKTRLNILKNIARDEHEQYFDPDIIKLNENEIFVDGGGFIGDTIQAFIKQSSNRFNAIYSFEPSKTNIENHINEFSHDNRIVIYNCGLGIKKTDVKFNEKGAASAINEHGLNTIQIEKIDDILNGECASFIKMDIEGAELDALLGAENTICRCKPKLAICVYHRDMDVFNITHYLKQCVPNYKFYLRHYTHSQFETVLYAVV